MQPITRAQVQELRTLHRRSGRRSENSFLVEGEKLVQEACGSGWDVTHLICTEELLAHKPSLLLESGVPSERQFSITPALLERLSTLVKPPPVAAVVQKRRWDITDLANRFPLAWLVDISDPGNLGTMIRTAEWFGVGGIVLSERCVDPFNEKVIRAAMGSLFRVPITVSEDLLGDLEAFQGFGYTVIAADAHGSTSALESSPRVCLVMGSEAHGLPDEYLELSDRTLAIPGVGAAESLNVSVSFGIGLYMLQQAGS